jgi:hypothetical protein
MIARVRVQVGLACRALGDEDTARLELVAARRDFEALGALTDLGRIATLMPTWTRGWAKRMGSPPASSKIAARGRRQDKSGDRRRTVHQ